MDYKIEPHRIFLEDDEGKLLAEVTFPVSNGVAHINHTFVDSSLRGEGIAAKLLEMAVEIIEKKGLKIVPSCSYAAVWFDRHPTKKELLF